MASLDPAQIDEDRVAGVLATAGMPDPDLIIRTSGEQRLSNFLLWQARLRRTGVPRRAVAGFRRRALRGGAGRIRKAGAALRCPPWLSARRDAGPISARASLSALVLAPIALACVWLGGAAFAVIVAAVMVGLAVRMAGPVPPARVRGAALAPASPMSLLAGVRAALAARTTRSPAAPMCCSCCWSSGPAISAPIWSGAGSAGPAWRRGSRPARPGRARSAACSPRLPSGCSLPTCCRTACRSGAVALIAGRPGDCCAGRRSVGKLRQAAPGGEGFRPSHPRPWRPVRSPRRRAGRGAGGGPAGAHPRTWSSSLAMTPAPRSVTVLGSTGSVGTQTVELLAAHARAVPGPRPGRRPQCHAAGRAGHRAEGRPRGDCRPGRLRRAAPGAVRHRHRHRRRPGGRGGGCRAAGRLDHGGDHRRRRPRRHARRDQPRRRAWRWPTRRRWSAPARSCCARCATAGATLLPVDSEHNAIFQALEDDNRGAVEKIVLTASGGPFRTAIAARRWPPPRRTWRASTRSGRWAPRSASIPPP